MRNLHNIEKSAFRKGEYVGYANGVWHISKSNSSSGTWFARRVDDPNIQMFAFGLEAMSRKLTVYEDRTKPASVSDIPNFQEFIR